MFTKVYKLYGHPGGTTKGATAMRQVVDLTLAGKELNKENVRKYPELKEAMNHFGYKVRF